MAEFSSQPDPKEATEARLCAYLEGELPAGERAEIEQHLVNNPQHGQLLVDLAKTREWMRSIPRESAPPEIAEGFSQQVERSMLLDETAAEQRSAGIRWPQFMLGAAIVALMIGLGVVIYAILRPPGGDKMISMNKSLSPASRPAIAQAKAPVTTSETLFAAATAAPSASPAMVESAKRSVAASNVTLVDKTVTPTRIGSANTDAAAAMLRANGYLLPTDRKTILFVVSSSSTASTTTQVRAFFDRHNMAVQDRSALGAASTMPSTKPSQPLLLASQATPLQVELLNASLAVGAGNPSVTRTTLDESPTTMPTQPVAGAISKGQTLSITIPQLVGPGIDKTNVTKVADDGTIQLPMLIEPLPAAGVTPAELQRRIADKYREMNLIQTATVSLEQVTSKQPTTQPTTVPFTNLITVPTTAPATTQPVATLSPTTQAIPAAEPTVNVVVVIQQALLPATQP